MAIDPTAAVSPRTNIGKNVSIGAFTVLHDNVSIGDDVRIGSHCILGEPSADGKTDELVIGDRSLIRSHSIFYLCSRFGADLRTGHRVTVREHIVAGEGMQIGTLSDLQGFTEFGDFVRLHSNVFVAQFSKIADYVFLFPGVLLTNDPHPPSDDLVGVTVQEYAVLGARATVLAGVCIAPRSLVAAHSMVTKDVAADTVVAGVPAKLIGPTRNVRLRDGSSAPAYPWTHHFHRGYPDHVLAGWKRHASP